MVSGPKHLNVTDPSDSSGWWGELWPVGSIYLSVLSTNPGTLFGFGTWTAFATGRTLIGIDTNQTEFASSEQTGGEKTHVLTAAEMPIHTHVQNAHTHSLAFTSGTGLGALGADVVPGADVTGSTTAVNQNAGGDGAHNTLMPYIVIYAWKRTA